MIFFLLQHDFFFQGDSIIALWRITCTTHPTDIEGAVFTLLFVVLPFGLTLIMFIRLLLLAKFHAPKITAQERAVGKKSDKRVFTTFYISTTVCFLVGLFPIIAVCSLCKYKWKCFSVQCCSWCIAPNWRHFVTLLPMWWVHYLRNTAFRQAAKH